MQKEPSSVLSQYSKPEILANFETQTPNQKWQILETRKPNRALF
jgi:hypothetical protein